MRCAGPYSKNDKGMQSFPKKEMHSFPKNHGKGCSTLKSHQSARLTKCSLTFSSQLLASTFRVVTSDACYLLILWKLTPRGLITWSLNTEKQRYATNSVSRENTKQE